MSRLFYFLLFSGYLAYAFIPEDRSQFGLLLTIYAFVFLIYLFNPEKNLIQKREGWLWFLACSLPLFFKVPLLSDDVYRFIWDGHLSISGINPFLYLPSELSSYPDLFPKLNSPQYYSVYPPLKQYIFAISAFLAGGSEELNIFWLRLFVLFSMLSGFYFFRKILSLLKKDEIGPYWLAFNPLILIESLGNLHFEVVVLSLLLSSYFVFLKSKSISWSAVLFGLAVSVKLIPLTLLPLIVRKLGLKKGLVFSLFVLIVNLILFMPFYSPQFFVNFGDSLDLYFHSFEFNAGLYYLLREIGFAFTGFNTIQYLGTALALTDLFLILWISFRTKTFVEAAVLILSIHLLLSTTVHPWYIIPLLGLSFITRLTYPLAWSGLIFLSYAAYRTEVVKENLWLTAFSYLLLFVFIFFDFRRKRIEAF